MAERTWDGEDVWRTELPAHHDLERLPDGRIVVLTGSKVVSKLIKDNELTILSPQGEVLGERSIDEMFEASGDEVLARQTGSMKGAYDDRYHCNSVFWMPPGMGEHGELYAESNVLVSIRHQDAVVAFDWEAGRAVWAWGRGEVQRPHEASVLPDGRVLMFDNGLAQRGYSRVVEMDPASGEITWEYRAPVPEDFFSEGRGTAQALPNGNVLVGNSNSGEAFEVTREGEVVWRYLATLTDANGARPSLRIQRYEREMVEAILAAQR